MRAAAALMALGVALAVLGAGAYVLVDSRSGTCDDTAASKCDSPTWVKVGTFLGPAVAGLGLLLLVAGLVARSRSRGSA